MKATCTDYIKLDPFLLPEHISYTFKLEDIPRYVLQEIARHRTMSLTVKSSRYTLKKDLKKEEPFYQELDEVICDFERASKYVELGNDTDVNIATVKSLEELRKLVVMGKSNDVIKPALPEGYYCNLYLTLYLNDLIHFLKLRLAGSALKDIRVLSKIMLDAIPDEHIDVFRDLEDLYNQVVLLIEEEEKESCS